ncbi:MULTISPECIES: FMN-dependent NADH-azoreductase [unclassified Meridianimarinicoccus]|uniref:FMN-dependent NADH-azoreductase n=1 Tax=unclassified Meridianimarinicoccus TaxID=2923344 RepID=UPI001867BC7B|nr:NAD(P)H-dependent oxidoreductase [Fluviibacterium sp. MJW13]
MTHILHIDSSARLQDSVTRDLSARIVTQLSGPETQVIRRDLAGGLPLLSETWVIANATPEAERTEAQKAELALSDTLVSELESAETIVIGVPVYNFNAPAVFKAWIDLVARAGRTFRYTSEGPQGLLTGKRVVLAVASGGTQVGSPIDHMTGYLRHVLGFIGLDQIEIVAADQLARNPEETLAKAFAAIPKIAA